MRSCVMCAGALFRRCVLSFEKFTVLTVSGDLNILTVSVRRGGWGCHREQAALLRTVRG